MNDPTSFIGQNAKPIDQDACIMNIWVSSLKISPKLMETIFKEGCVIDKYKVTMQKLDVEYEEDVRDVRHSSSLRLGTFKKIFPSMSEIRRELFKFVQGEVDQSSRLSRANKTIHLQFKFTPNEQQLKLMPIITLTLTGELKVS